MRVYMADLASYNEGHLTGQWVDVEGLDEHGLTEAADKVLRLGQAKCDPRICIHEEIAIHDYDGPDFGLGEYPQFEELVRIQEAIDEHGEEVVAAWMGNFGDGVDFNGIVEAYQGEWSSFKEFAEDWIESTGMLDGKDETLVRYFDYDSFARDLEYDYWTEDSSGGVLVFLNI